MINRVTTVLRSLFGTRIAGRRVTVRDDDRFIVSYPKSGNTWMRFLVANLIANDVSFESIERLVPDIYQNTDRLLARLPSPRFLKSHERFDSRYRTTLYIVRDPRDVVLSYFHHHRKFQTRFSNFGLSEFVSAFVDGNIDNYGSWEQNVSSWVDARGNDADFLLLRYEDLKRDPESGLATVAKLFGLDTSQETIAASVQSCDFSRLQGLERQQGQDWKPLAGTREDMQFVRKGEVGSWKAELSADDVSAIEQAFGSTMRALGYL